MTVKSRLIGLSLLGVVPLLVVSSAAIWGLERLDPKKSDVHVYADALRNHMAGDMMHDALRADVLSALLAQSQQDFKEVNQDLTEHSERFEKALADNQALPLPSAISTALTGLGPDLKRYIESARTLVATAERDKAAAHKAMPEFLSAFRTLDGSQDKVSDLISTASSEAQTNAVRTAQSAKLVCFTLCLLAIVALVVGTVFIVRSIVRPLNANIDQLIDAVEQFHVTSNQISEGGQLLADRASHQAATLEETSASVEELSSMTRANAESSNTAVSQMEQMNQRMSDTNRLAKQMGASMSDICKSNEAISQIIKMINGIAFQTNILALNAAVEAARAGEAGLGFAVVADEVRNLAKQCAKAAEDTTQLVTSSVEITKAGMSQIAAVTHAVESVVTTIEQTKSTIESISTATNEQARGVQQIASAMTRIDQATQANAASAEENAAASAQMIEQAGTLGQVAAQLTTMTRGHQLQLAINHTQA